MTRARWAQPGGANSSPGEFHPGIYYGSPSILNIAASLIQQLCRKKSSSSHIMEPAEHTAKYYASANHKEPTHGSYWEPTLAFVHFLKVYYQKIYNRKICDDPCTLCRIFGCSTSSGHWEKIYIRPIASPVYIYTQGDMWQLQRVLRS